VPRWSHELSPADAAAIHAYLIDLQSKTRAQELDKQQAGVPLDAPRPLPWVPAGFLRVSFPRVFCM
jgi:hypothetical protein